MSFVKLLEDVYLLRTTPGRTRTHPLKRRLSWNAEDEGSITAWPVSFVRI